MSIGLIILVGFILAGVIAWWLDRKNLKSQLAGTGATAKPIVQEAVQEVEKVAGEVKNEAVELGSAALTEIEKLLPEISLASIEADIQSLQAKIAKAQAQQQAKARALQLNKQTAQENIDDTLSTLTLLEGYKQMVSATTAASLSNGNAPVPLPILEQVAEGAATT